MNERIRFDPSKPTISVLWDVDNVLVNGPPSTGTIIKLITRTFKPYAAENAQIKVNKSTRITRIIRLSAEHALHAIRSEKPDARESLLMFTNAIESNGRNARNIISSGRMPHLHELTHKQLRALEEWGLIDEWRLNPGYKSPVSKLINGTIVLSRTEENPEMVILCDDDPLASQTFTENEDPRKRSYLLKTLASFRGFMKWARVELNTGVVEVCSFPEAAEHLQEFFASKKIS